MKKRIIAIIMVVFLLQLFGCGIDTQSTKNSNEKTVIPNDSESNKNEKLVIYNKEQYLDEIYHFGYIFQIDGGFIYSKWNDINESTAVMEYYCYSFTDKKSDYLGDINDWSFQTQESVFINNRVYFFVITGDFTSQDNRELKIMEVDVKQSVLSEVFSEKGGFPYNSMEKKDESLLINLVKNNGSSLEEYNTETKEIKQLKWFNYDDEKRVGEAVRNMSVDEDKKRIFLLTLKNEESKSPTLLINTFDYQFNIVNSKNISSIFSEDNETIQGVTSFECNEDYFYYENFSLTRYLGLFQKESIVKFTEINEYFDMSHETVKNNKKFFYRSLDNRNDIYCFNVDDYSLRKANLKLKDERYYIINMYNNKDNLSILMSYKDPDTGEEHDSILYYINYSDLDFK